MRTKRATPRIPSRMEEMARSAAFSSRSNNSRMMSGAPSEVDTGCTLARCRARRSRLPSLKSWTPLLRFWSSAAPEGEHRMTATYQSLRIEKAEGVAEVILTGPGKGNALGPDFWREMPEALSELEADTSVRVLVLR